MFQSMVVPVLLYVAEAYESIKLQEAEHIPDEVFKGYFRGHSAEQEEE